VATYSFWQRRFGGSASVLAKTIHAGKATLEIIGVAEPNFRGENVGHVPGL
jgi:hypothetical protein